MPRRGAGGRAPHAPMPITTMRAHRLQPKLPQTNPRNPPAPSHRCGKPQPRRPKQHRHTSSDAHTGHMSRFASDQPARLARDTGGGHGSPAGATVPPPPDVFSHGPTRRGRWQSRQPAGSREQRERAAWAGGHRAHEARGPQSPSERGSDGEVRTDTTWKRWEEPVITSKPKQREKRTHKQNTRRYQGARRHWTAPRSRHAPRERERGAVRQGGPDTHHGREKRRR